MLKQTLAIVLVWALLAPGAGAASAKGSDDPKPTLKEKILDIPGGSIIEVRTTDKKKLHGKLGEISDEGFALQILRNDKLETQQIAFAQMKSVKVLAVRDTAAGKAGRTAGWIIVGGLAGLGVIVLIALIAYAAGGN